MTTPLSNGNGTVVPSWLVKSLAWACLMGAALWMGHIQGVADGNTVTTADLKTKVAVNETHWAEVKEQLNRIETKVNRR